MKSNTIEMEMHNVDAEDGLREMLKERGGKAQVPALDVDGKIMYESMDIIDYLKDNH
ncbi:glutathione S-transferase N-terminal domain-containing protein [Peptoniphilus equinus]|uniref:Glutathione S-transferase N-terminal domain-containing protein n=1 Tax=Peptoniphilus equinus TaxID=3016343 RepID=A0ABY7QS55_9FIRM|nr:glutathione S-transferase N-terminal domain-containing protein [Peptoniphilus equinus]WBW49614.1 glutathione S-transferase N-terminal domain-containing protein [Peptoniphilus equinus]